MSSSHSRALAIAERVYRLMLAAYPPAFRQRFGPEMAQVFRTVCRATYRVSGISGLLRLWLHTLGDWAWSAVGEWFASSSTRWNVYPVYIRRSASQLIPLLLFFSSCLLCLLCNPCSWLGSESPFGTWTCELDIVNQMGKTLRVTPVDTNHNTYASVRLYRTTFPIFPAYQQRDISVGSNDTMPLSYACSAGLEPGLILYVCDLTGECYVQDQYHYVYRPGRTYGRFTLQSLEALSRPDVALQATVGSYTEHNYSAIKIVISCLLAVIAVIAGFGWLVLFRAVDIPNDI